MNKKLTFLFLIPFLFGFTKNGVIKNYYGISEVLSFNSSDYKLSNSYHPVENYWKQEYLPDGQTPDHFDSMITIDFCVTDSTATHFVASKIIELSERKKTDAVCNYRVLENKHSDEYILDFIMSESLGNRVTIVERNIYHYKNYTDKAGHKGTLLFGISHRAYGNDITSYLKSINATLEADIKRVNAFEVPQIEIE